MASLSHLDIQRENYEGTPSCLGQLEALSLHVLDVDRAKARKRGIPVFQNTQEYGNEVAPFILGMQREAGVEFLPPLCSKGERRGNPNWNIGI